MKMSLAHMQGKLSRAEMKDLMGGQEQFKNQTDGIVGDGESDATQTYPRIEACKNKMQGDSCSYYLNNKWYNGICVWVMGAPDRFCYSGY